MASASRLIPVFPVGVAPLGTGIRTGNTAQRLSRWHLVVLCPSEAVVGSCPAHRLVASVDTCRLGAPAWWGRRAPRALWVVPSVMASGPAGHPAAQPCGPVHVPGHSAHCESPPGLSVLCSVASPMRGHGPQVCILGRDRPQCRGDCSLAPGHALSRPSPPHSPSTSRAALHVAWLIRLMSSCWVITLTFTHFINPLLFYFIFLFLNLVFKNCSSSKKSWLLEQQVFESTGRIRSVPGNCRHRGDIKQRRKEPTAVACRKEPMAVTRPSDVTLTWRPTIWHAEILPFLFRWTGYWQSLISDPQMKASDTVTAGDVCGHASGSLVGGSCRVAAAVVPSGVCGWAGCMALGLWASTCSAGTSGHCRHWKDS